MNSRNESSFFVTLLSDTRCSFHPNNTPSDFVNRLYRRYQLDEHYQVAIVDISVPQTVCNVYNNQSIAWVQTGRKEVIKRARFPKDLIVPDIHTLLRLLQQSLDNFYKFELVDNKVICKPQNGEYKLKLSATLSEQLGINFNPTYVSGNITAERKPNLNVNVPKQVFVCTNIVKQTCFGNTTLPLLRTFSLKSNQDARLNDIQVQFHKLIYVPLAVTDLEKIEINIRDRSGELVSFGEGTSTVTLHFMERLHWL